MLKKFNVFALALLIIGQTILGPMAVSAETIPAETEAHADEVSNVSIAEASADPEPEKEKVKDEPEESSEAPSEDETADKNPIVETESQADKPKDEESAVTTTINEPDKVVEPAEGEEPESDEALVKATKAVEKAEKSKAQEDIEAAKALVTTLEDSAEKTALQERVDVLEILEINDKSIEIKEDIITNVELTLAGGGKLPNPMPHPSVEPALDLELKYEFKLTNTPMYEGGAYYKFKLPDVFAVHNIAGGDLISPDGRSFGVFELATDGTVTMTFNDEINNNSNVTGYLSFWTEIDGNLGGSTNQIIKVPISDEKTVDFEVNFEPKEGSSIDKRGTPNKQYNAETIRWEVDLNKNLTSIENVQLLDPLGENQEFVPGSIKVYALDIQLDGSVIEGEELTGHSFGIAFPLNFGNTDKAYRVVFETEITDEDEKNYKNTATLTGKNIEDLPADAEVWVNRGKPLEKTAGNYDLETQWITWEVKYNYNEKVIGQDKAFLIDTFGEGHVFDGIVKVEEIEIDPNNGHEAKSTEFTNFTVSNEANGFKLQFDQDINKAYKITYQTKVIDRITEDTTFTNKVTDGNDKEDSKDKWIGQAVFHKYHYNDQTDYDAKTTKWGISINDDNKVMKNVVLTDTLPNGLTLDNYTITYGGENLTEGTDYAYSYNEATGEIKFDFTNKLEPVTKKIYIEYTTSFDINEIEEGKTSFTNDAKLKWIPENETESKEMEKEATFTPNEYTKHNGSKGGSYNAVTKEITWEVGVNYTSKEIDNAIVEDIILGNQNFDISSIEVYKMAIEPNGKWKKEGEALEINKDYDVDSIVGPNDEPGFKVTLGKISEPYVIVYTTDLNDQLITKTYDNTATLKDGETHLTDLSTSVSVGDNGGKYTGKETKQNSDNPRVLNWKVSINATQSTISDVVLIDKPSSNQLILQDSFVLYGTTVAQNGSLTKNAEDKLVEGKDYTLEFKEDEEGNEYFELAFKEEIDRAYILEYDTFIMAGNNQFVNNNASLTGNQLTNEKTDTDHKHQVKLTGAGGGIDGRVGQLEVTKVDATDTDKTIAGAEFTLFDSTGTIAIKTLTTEEDGKVTFKNLLFGDYVLEETKVPEGYILDSTKYPVLVGDKEQEITKVSVENTPRGTVQLTKTDKDTNELLKGVEFELQKKNDSGVYETISTHKTDDKGQIHTLKTLEAGDYQFVEKAPLEGYRTNADLITFTVDINNPNTQTFTMTNEKFKGSVKLTKSDAATKTLLAGAEFKLVDAEGNLVEKDLVTNEQGEFEIGDLLLGKYQLIETKAPEGYKLNETPIDVEITKDLQVVEKTMTNNKITDVSVEKKWNNAGGETTPVTVKLLPTEKTVELNEENNWQATFEGLRVYDELGKEIDYQVEEEAIDGYKSTVTGDSEAGFIVTNTELTNVSGEKTWLDDESDQRPGLITVQLLANGDEVKAVEVTAKSNWTYEFTNLVKYDESGKEITYTIDEVEVEGYETTIDGFDLTNLRVGKTEVSGEKTWLDDNSEERPSTITVNLLANGDATDKKVEVTASSEWKYSFTDLDQYDDAGKEIVYTIDEDEVDGYQTSIDKHDLTNLRIGTTEVEITKLWKDENAADRPDIITVNLLRNGVFYQEYEVTKENSWKLTITDLPQYDEEGKVNNYSVTEHDVSGYASTVEKLDITNTRADVKTINITKAWLDDESTDRPDSIEVELFRSIVDGEKELVETITVTATDGWEYERVDLPVFNADGKAYTYEIEEKPVEGYEASVNGFDLTNTRVGTISVEGTKTWKDDKVADRPELIKVDLLQNGEVVDTVEVTAETDWTYRFGNLAEFDENGVAYVYTVKEQPVSGYTSTVDGYDITNTLNPVDPTDPEEPVKPGDNGNNDKPGSGNESGSGKLPQTGEEQFMYMITLGVLLLAAGGLVLYRQRRKA